MALSSKGQPVLFAYAGCECTGAGCFSRSKDTIAAGTFDISPVETGANLGANAWNAVTRGAVTFDKMGVLSKVCRFPRLNRPQNRPKSNLAASDKTVGSRPIK